MGGDQDGFARGAQAREGLHQGQALARVGARQRLVQHQHVGIVDQGLRDLDALAHALGVAAQPAIRRVEHLHGVQRLLGGLAGPRQAVQLRGQLHEFAPGEKGVQALLLRHQPDAPVQRRIIHHRLAKHAHGAAARP